MRSREAKTYAEGHAYPGWSAYFAGRCGVLGEVDASVVQAIVGFFPERTVSRAWASAREIQPLAAASRDYQQVMAGWAARNLDGFDGAARLAALLERLVDAADPAGAPLFAAWRAAERPSDPAALVVQLAHVAREHRGAAHLVAVRAVGLAPLEAVVAGPYGVANARYFGWPSPYPEVTPEVAARYRQAEELTDELAGPAYDVFDEAEVAELADLLAVASRDVRMPLG
jgi:hypothetical protein